MGRACVGMLLESCTQRGASTMLPVSFGYLVIFTFMCVCVYM